MRTLVVIALIMAVAAPLLAQSSAPVLGPIDALGQQVKRPPAPTAPAPRLPDGTIDLGDGIWVSTASFGPDISVGLKSGDVLSLLPSAQALIASRTLADDPVNWCLPLGVLRYSPYPFRFMVPAVPAVRTRLCVAGIVAVALPLVAPPIAAAQNPTGALGPVNALGQEVTRPPAPTSPVPRLPDGTIDLGDGIWVSNPFTPETGPRLGEALLLPAAKALMASRKTTDDPLAWCLPMGAVRYTPYPFRFIQNYTHKKPTHMHILYETMRTFRQIFLDGRTHPAELDPTWFGHSIGWYEKDTLVIDTVGFNDKAWFDNRGMPHTEQLHTVERWTRVDMGHMTTEVRIDDPGTFSRPFTVTFRSELGQPGDELMEYVCNENNQYGIASGVTPARSSR